MKKDRYAYPTIVKRIDLGDSNLAESMRQDGNILLWQLKNMMRSGKITTNRAIRYYSNGAIITVISITPKPPLAPIDIIEIDVRAAVGPPECSVTFIGVPEVIPPMRYPGIIGTGGIYTGPDPWGLFTGLPVPLEVEGIDFIKTYYVTSRKNCDLCSEDKWTLCNAGEVPVGFGAVQTCLPFFYDETLFPDSMRPFRFEGESLQHIPHAAIPVPPPANLLAYINNHCIHSLSTCQAEIIDFGADDDGQFFRWKAYTEWSSVGGPGVIIFSRTGLGYLDLKLHIDTQDLELCKGENLVKVDCCKKTEDLRRVALWWESLSGYEAGGPTCAGQPIMFYGSMAMCEVPPEAYGLYLMLCVPRNSKYLYVLPDVTGSCPPYTWSASGPITVHGIEPMQEIAHVDWNGPCPDSNDPSLCTQRASVTVTDRCGKSDTVEFLSCCDELARGGGTPLSLGYTSLVLDCGESQSLSAIGGCGPYTWSSAGGGTISGTSGQSITYTAPANNAGCGSNGSVTVTDCCGNSAGVQIAINCADGYAGSTAMEVASRIIRCCFRITEPDCAGREFDGTCAIQISQFDCNGDSLNACTWNEDAECIYPLGYDENGGPLCTNFCPCVGGGNACWDNNCAVSDGGSCQTSLNPMNCDQVYDLRSAEMKAAGCCPLNPITGLPY